MKSTYIICLVYLFCYTSAISQDCFPNGISVTTQEQIDEFSNLYPNCTNIQGNLSIQEDEYETITSLAGLEQITSVEGNLDVSLNSKLISLYGLHNISTLEGSISIFDNDMLKSILALEQIESIGGYLSIGKNDSLTNLVGVHNINYGISNLRLFANPVLAFCSFDNICQYLSNGGTHLISGNAPGCSDTNEISSICIINNPCTRSILRLHLPSILSGTYQAIDEIQSRGQIQSFEEVHYRAGNCILFGEGFSVAKHTILTAEIEACGL